MESRQVITDLARAAAQLQKCADPTLDAPFHKLQADTLAAFAQVPLLEIALRHLLSKPEQWQVPLQELLAGQAVPPDLAQTAQDLHKRLKRLVPVPQPQAPPPMNPATPDDWMAIAELRMKDGRLLLGERTRQAGDAESYIGAVYIVGYAVECGLKGLLKLRHVSFATSGSEGHKLGELWGRADFTRKDLADSSGNRTFFIDTWSTDMRYDQKLSNWSSVPADELVEGAGDLLGKVKQKYKREQEQKNRRSGAK